MKEWDFRINYGIKTGLNEVFIVDTATKDWLCKEDPKNEEILKPVLRGRDIKRYGCDWADLWLIFIPWHFPLHQDTSIVGVSQRAESEFRKRYPVMYNYLLRSKAPLSKRNIAETGIRYEWYALQRCAATYYADFEKEKIVWPRLTRIHKSEDTSFPRFSMAEKNTFIIDSLCFITGSQIRYLIAILNSSYAAYYFHQNIAILDNGGMQMRQQYIENVPIPQINPVNQPLVLKIELLATQIMADKKKNTKADTSTLERQVDYLVYKLYGLTEEEIAVVEGRK